MWPSKKKDMKLITVEQQISAIKMAELELRINGLEQAIIELCHGLRSHLDRIDHNTEALDRKIHNLADAILTPPKDILGGPERGTN